MGPSPMRPLCRCLPCAPRGRGHGLAWALGAALACGSCHRPDATQLVVGIQSDPMGGVVSALHIVIRVAGTVVDDERVQPPHGSKVGFPQPWEKTLPGPARGQPRRSMSKSTPSATRRPRRRSSQRLSSTHFVPGRTALLRIPLESRCIVYPAMPRGASKVPGPLSGPRCTAPATCIMGVCQSSDVPPARLEPYAANWPTNAPDRCKQRDGVPADLQVGTGQSYYLPLTPGQTLQAEAGPQGGHHIWIATRMKNMKQMGTTTKISGVQPGTGAQIPPTTLAFTYSPDEGGYCKLYGIRYQLDNEGIDYKQFLGKPLDVSVTSPIRRARRPRRRVHIQIAPTLVNP